jgi:hypothetical protein
MRILITLAMVLLCGACAAPTHFDTPSGHPEVTISRVAPDKVKAALVNKMIDRGYRLTKDSQFELAFDKPTDNAAAIILFTSDRGDRPNTRVAYSMAGFQASIAIS